MAALQSAAKPWAKFVPSVKEKCMAGAAVIIFQGKNRNTKYVDGTAVPADEPEDTYMPFIIRGRDDVFHAETVRKSKGYTIAAVEHLDNLAKSKPEEARVIATLVQRITASPEVQRKLDEANDTIAALEAKLAEVQGTANVAKIEADLKAEADARAAAEAKIAELEAKLAKAGEGAKKSEK